MRLFLMLFIMLNTFSSFVCAVEYNEQDLLKLFTDKQQREKIDALRSGQAPGSEVKKSDKIKLQGYVKRSDGRSVVWINDKSSIDSNKLDDVKIYQSTIGKNKKVSIAVDGKSVRLKPGQTWYKDTGKIVDNH